MNIRKKVLVVFGTRPEAIKLYPVIDAFNKSPNFDLVVCSTGQHKEMLEHVLNLFEIDPDYNLNLMDRCDSLESLSAQILIEIKNILHNERPNYIIVQGDTTTAMCSSLAAFYSQIPVVHLEAGLRTFDNSSPFPEEVNRKIIATYADIHLAPTKINKLNLINEGINKDKIFITGNTVIDTLFIVNDKLKSNKYFKNKVFQSLKNKINLNFLEKNFIIVTCHRRENHGANLKQIIEALINISRMHKDYNIIFPVHLNPNIYDNVTKSLSNIDNIKLCSPLNYVEFVYLLDKCKLIISDSGGIQEEAPSLGKPVIVIREFTERVEAIDAGTVILAGVETDSIIHEVNTLLTDDTIYNSMSNKVNPYGNGTASEEIIKLFNNL